MNLFIFLFHHERAVLNCSVLYRPANITLNKATTLLINISQRTTRLQSANKETVAIQVWLRDDFPEWVRNNESAFAMEMLFFAY